jgi:hypothetical protein
MSNYSDMPGNQRKPIDNIEHSLRSMSRLLDTMFMDTQNIKSDLALIKLYIDEIQKKEKQKEKENDDLNKGWFYF